MINLTKEKAGYLLIAGVIVLLPLVITLGLVRFHLDAQLSDSIPIYYGTYNDAFFYWRQVDTFRAAGFNGGYYTLNENPAAATFTHFYTHGPMFPLIYGTVSQLTGWEYYSGTTINLLLITVGLGLFVYMTRPTLRQLLALGVVVATCWYILLYLPATMQETLHTLFAILMAIVFNRMLRRDEPLSWQVTVLVIVLIGIMALVRVLWAFMYLPFFVLSIRKPTLIRLGLAVVMAGILVVAFFGITTLIMPPYPFYYTDELIHDFGVSLEHGWATLAHHLQLNYDNFDNPYTVNLVLSNASWLPIFERYQVLLVMIGALVTLAVIAVSRRIPQFEAVAKRVSWREATAHFLILAPIMAFMFVLYDFFQWHDFRTLAPPFIVCLLLLVGQKRYAVIGLVALSSLLVLPMFMDEYIKAWEPQFTYDQGKISAFHDQVKDIIVYDEDAPNQWCNTLLTQMADRDGRSGAFPPELMAIDARIGISFFVFPEAVTTPLKSKYWLMDVNTINAIPNTRTNILGYTPIGNLYLNLDAPCWPEEPDGE